MTLNFGGLDCLILMYLLWISPLCLGRGSMEIFTNLTQDFDMMLMLLSIIIATIAGVFTYFTYKLKIGQKAKACCAITYPKGLPYISSVIN